jgi:hypothetical protein
VLTELGAVEIDVPRDRDGSFEPKIVKRRQRRLDSIDEIVLSLTARGLTTTGPHRPRTGTLGHPLESRPERLRHHLRRPPQPQHQLTPGRLHRRSNSPESAMPERVRASS